jgi:hypothetical protein
MPKQRERCHSFFIAAVVLNQCFGDLGKLPTLLVLPQIPCEQQLLIELAINSGDFYVMFQRESHFINKRIQKPRRLNMKCIPAVNSVNKTNRNRYNSQS